MISSYEELLQWMNNQAEQKPYSEIGVKFIVHGGKVVRIEKTIIEKEQP